MTARLPASKELVVLRILRDGPRDMYGLEIVRESNDQLGRAAIYVTLARMEDKGYIKSRTPAQDSHPGLPRPRYKLTPLGELALRAAETAHEMLALASARTAG